jgi:peroxiredoxin Q/BCP
MRTNLSKVLGVAVVATVAAVFAIQATALQNVVKKGTKAPVFSAEGTDGKTHTLSSLTKDGPVHLYFIKEGCPVNHRAAPHVTKIDSTYSGKAKIIGVYNGSLAGAKRWASRYGAKYPILADPDLKIIRSFGAPYSPFLISVDKSGKVENVLEGLSPRELTRLNAGAAEVAGMKVTAMTFEGAPSGGG